MLTFMFLRRSIKVKRIICFVLVFIITATSAFAFFPEPSSNLYPDNTTTEAQSSYYKTTDTTDAIEAIAYYVSGYSFIKGQSTVSYYVPMMSIIYVYGPTGLLMSFGASGNGSISFPTQSGLSYWVSCNQCSTSFWTSM